MRKRRFIVSLCALLVFALGIAIYLSRRTLELTWNGNPSSYWIARLNHYDQNGHVPAEEFLFAAGPQVVPELIRGLKLRDNWLSDRWSELYFKLGKLQRFFDLPIKRASYRANCARGLGLLGVAASEAEPDLVRALKDKDHWVRSAAAETLGRIAADKSRVAPLLVAGLSSQDQNHRLACIIGLTHCVSRSAEAAKALRAVLRDPDPNKRAWAAGGLWMDMSDPRATFASLAEALRDENATVRDRAAQSIGKLRYRPDHSAEALRVALAEELAGKRNEIVVWKILHALAEIGPAAQPAVPVLKSLTQTNDHAATLAVIALGRIEPENPEWIDQLVKRLEPGEGDHAFWAAWELGKRGEAARTAVEPLRRLAESPVYWRTKAMAATAAWRLDPSSPNPLNSITNNLSQQTAGHYEIVRLLGELGSAARPAVPTLRRLRYSRGIMTHDYAEDALQNVAPEYLSNPWKVDGAGAADAGD